MCKDVGKIQVQRYEGPLLAPAYLDDASVWLATESLLSHGVRIMSGGCRR